MKLRYLFSAILASVLMFTGCVQESIDSFEDIKLSQTYLLIPEAGGSVKLTIDSKVDWEFVTTETWPKYTEKVDGKDVVKDAWLSVDKMAGFAGVTEVTFTAEKAEAGREFELQIKAGNKSQFVRVRQGSMVAEEAKCEDVIAGPDGKTYIVQGICTKIANDYYGNWYMNDGTGEIYIYGTVNADGDYDWESFDIEEGDSVKVEGPKTTFNEVVELVGVSVIKVVKTLLKLPEKSYMAELGGETFDIKLAYKGKGVFYNIPEEYKSWVSVENMEFKAGTPSKLEPNPADTAIVYIKVLENEGKTRQGAVEFSSSNGESTSISLYNFAQAGIATIAEVIADTEIDAQAVVAGQVVAKHGNGVIVSDETASIYVYSPETTLEVGNNVVLAGTFGNNFGTIQIKNIEIKSNDKATAQPVHAAPINLQYQADYDALGTFSKDNPITISYIKVRGVVEKDDYGVYIKVGTSEIRTCLYKTATDYTEKVGKTVVVTAYLMGYNSNYKYYQVIETSVAEVTDELPAITLTEIKDVAAGETTYTVAGVVVAVGQAAYVMADATGNLLVHGYNHGRKVMEKVRVTGIASHYSGYSTNTLQLVSSSTDLIAVGSSWTYAPTVLDATAFDAWIGKDPSTATEVQVTGTVVKSDSYLNINVEGSTKLATFKYVDTAEYEKFIDKKVVIKGYVMGTYQRLSILPYSVTEVTE